MRLQQTVTESPSSSHSCVLSYSIISQRDIIVMSLNKKQILKRDADRYCRWVTDIEVIILFSSVNETFQRDRKETYSYSG